MQAFYPSPPRHTLALVLLGVLVLLLHGVGLHGLSSAWPGLKPAATPVRVQLQMAAQAPTLTPRVTEPTPARRASKPRPAASSAPSTTAVLDTPATPEASKEAAPAAPVEAPQPDVVAGAQDNSAQAEDNAAAGTDNAATAPMTEPPVTEKTATPPLPPVSSSDTTAAQTTASSSNAWLSQAVFLWPAPSKLWFEVVGQSKGIRYSADGDIVWQHDGSNYQMRQEVRHMLLGSRSQTSVGALSLQGLQPLRFGDKYKQEVAAHFERDKQRISFSSNAPSQTLQDGAQDRLSVLAQLASLMAGSPHLRQAGQALQLQVAAPRSADVWSFVVEKQESLKLPIGSLPTLKLSRMPLLTHDQTVEIWLSPSHGYLPAKVRISQSNGDVLEQLLRKVETP
jgi:outer membrane lipoprotein-sorting protein